jgi:hypothetical protein
MTITIFLIPVFVFLNTYIVKDDLKTTALISGFSLILLSISLVYTDRSFHRTENTIKKAEKDSEIRKIEESLNKFYYPLEYIIYWSRIIVDHATVFYFKKRTLLPYSKQMFVLSFYMSIDFEMIQNIIKF